MSKRPLIAGIGELLWDKLPEGKKVGGAPANCVYHAACLGAEGYIISAVGNDNSGRELLSELNNTPLHHIIDKVDKPTGSVNVIIQEGIPEYTITENTAWDFIPVSNKSLSLMKKIDALCYGSLACRNNVSHNTIITLLKHANPSSLRLYDINIRGEYYSKELVVELLHYASIFKIDKEEAIILKNMMGRDISDKVLSEILMEKYNLKYLIITNGSIDSTIYAENESSTIRTPYINISDTIGAGDAFAGAFLYFTLVNMPLAEAHQMAVNTASFVCTQSGAWPKYPKELSGYKL